MIVNGFLRKCGLALLGMTAILTFTTAAKAAAVYGGTTTVDLNTTTVDALVGLGFSIAPIAPSTLGGMPLAATFPITGGNTTTAIDHSGGLAFTYKGTTVDIEDFIINLSGPSADTITGEVVDGATKLNGVAFFDIGSGLSLTLDSTLAGALTNIFGVPNLSGASIGTATVDAVTTPEPASLAMAGLGLLATGLWARRRSARK